MAVKELTVNERAGIADGIAAGIKTDHPRDATLRPFGTSLPAAGAELRKRQAAMDARRLAFIAATEAVTEADTAQDLTTSEIWFTLSGKKLYAARDYLFPDGIGFTSGSTRIEVGLLRRALERAGEDGAPDLSAVSDLLEQLPGQLDAVDAALEAQRRAQSDLRDAEGATRVALRAFDRLLSHFLVGAKFALPGAENEAARNKLLKPYTEAMVTAEQRRRARAASRADGHGATDGTGGTGGT
jgi:hypothetical protein